MRLLLTYQVVKIALRLPLGELDRWIQAHKHLLTTPPSQPCANTASMIPPGIPLRTGAKP